MTPQDLAIQRLLLGNAAVYGLQDMLARWDVVLCLLMIRFMQCYKAAEMILQFLAGVARQRFFARSIVAAVNLLRSTFSFARLLTDLSVPAQRLNTVQGSFRVMPSCHPLVSIPYGTR